MKPTINYAAKSDGDVLVPIDFLPARYNRAPRTIEGWLADKKLRFPRPVILRNKRYFSQAALEAFEARFADRFGARTEAA